MRTILITVACLVMVPAAAHAVPGTLAFTGRLSDAQGPLQGTVTVELAMFGQATGGTALWGEAHTTTADAGLVTLAIGGQQPIASLFDGSALFLELEVNGEVMTPRLPIQSVPFALRSGTSDSSDRLGTLAPADVALANHDHDSRYAAIGHDHDGRYALLGHHHNGVYAPVAHTHDTQYYPQSTLNTAGVINSSTNPVQWTKLQGVPNGFTDGVDNDSGGDITGVTAGTGLTGGASSGGVTLSVSFAGTGAATQAARSDHNHDTAYVKGNFTTRSGRIDCGTGLCASGSQTFTDVGSFPTVILTPERPNATVACQLTGSSSNSFSYACSGGAYYLHWMVIN